MGRTVMPFSHVLESERERWKPFRRALSKEDQEAFDRPPLFRKGLSDGVRDFGRGIPH